jgi:hypothetical protein
MGTLVRNEGSKMTGGTNLKTWVVISVFVLGMGCTAASGRTIYVDDDRPADFNNIQPAIEDANDGDTIVVFEGVYFENISFNGKNITLLSEDPNDSNIVAATVIDGKDANSVVTFSGTESSDCVLSGFTITNGNASRGGGIYGKGTVANIKNNIIIGNSAEYGGGLCVCDGTIQNNIIISNSATYGGGLDHCDGTIQNNIIVNNSARCGGGVGRCYGTIQNNTVYGNSATLDGGGLRYCHGSVRNCVIWQNTASRSGSQIMDCPPGACATPSYCCIQDWVGGGIGNISADPCFVDAVNDDYHLKSQAGRWDPNSETWVKDDVTSACIDAGDMSSPIGYEPFPNGGRVNMGAYGGTVEASKSYFGEPDCETIVAGDINGDCKVGFLDFALMAFHWLERVNLEPVVYITNPPDGFEFDEATESVFIVANAWDVDGSVVRVEFFADGYRFAADSDGSDGWIGCTSFNVGTYILRARATDNEGATTTSPPVTITAAEELPPVVYIIEPDDGSVIPVAQETIVIQASAYAECGASLVKVEFFANGNKIGEDNDGSLTDGWEMAWSEHEVGKYVLTAKATDNEGATTISPAVEITVVE